MPTDEYLDQRIFTPLGMDDTFFEIPKEKADRFLPNHTYDRKTKKINTTDSGKFKDSKKIDATMMRNYYDVKVYSGGGGLVSTAYDYMIFAESLRNGGAFNGNRILSPKTINFMTKNHLWESTQHILNNNVCN